MDSRSKWAEMTEAQLEYPGEAQSPYSSEDWVPGRKQPP